MQVLNDRSEMGAPGVCFVCETSPQGRVVDTRQNFTPGFPSQLAGGKYVCEGCAVSVSAAFGFVSDEAARAAQFAAQEAEAKLNAVLDEVKAFASEVVAGKLEDVAAKAVVVPEPETIVQVQGYEVAPPQVTDALSEPDENTISVPAAQVDEPKKAAPKQKAAPKEAVKDEKDVQDA